MCRALNGDDFGRKNTQRLGTRKAPGFNNAWRFVLGLILVFLLSACPAAKLSLHFLARLWVMAVQLFLFLLASSRFNS